MLIMKLRIIFFSVVIKIYTPQFVFVKRSGYGEGTDLKQKVVEFTAKDAYIPPIGLCFMNCVKFLTGKIFEQDFLDFIRNEVRRRNVMTTARIQPFCKKYNTNIGHYGKVRVYLYFYAERNEALYLYENYFCLK